MPSTIKKNGSRPVTGAITDEATSDVYFELVRAFPLRPIRSDQELDRAIAVLLKLSTSKSEESMDAGQRDYLEALGLLVQRFEQQRRGSILPKSSPLDRLKFLMKERGMNATDLGRILGAPSTASLVLHGKRALSKARIVKLAKHFAVSPALFIE